MKSRTIITQARTRSKSTSNTVGEQVELVLILKLPPSLLMKRKVRTAVLLRSMSLAPPLELGTVWGSLKINFPSLNRYLQLDLERSYVSTTLTTGSTVTISARISR